MKRILGLLLCVITISVFAQDDEDEAKRKFTFGFDIFADLWQEVPETIEPRTINQGVNLFGSYNYMFGNSNVSFSPGLGISAHNLYSDSWLLTKGDSSYFEPIPASYSFKRSKLTVTYLDIPLEIRYKSKGEFRIAVGFKYGFLLKAQTKIKGQDLVSESNSAKIITKQGKINSIEKSRYGFTGRIGYKWLNLWGYYQLSTLFITDRGPDMFPISLGISIIPF